MARKAGASLAVSDAPKCAAAPPRADVETTKRQWKKGVSELSGVPLLLVCDGLLLSLVFSVYVLTMGRGIGGGDAGELAVSACTLAVAHPPGYPLFTLLYHFSLRFVHLLLPLPLPISPAVVFNTLSALLSSFAVLLLHRSIYLFTHDAISSSVSALAFGLSPTVWLYASQAEVFALHNLGMALLLWLTIRVFEASDATNLLIVSAFTSGLCLCNQHTSVLYIAPIVLCVLPLLLQSRGRHWCSVCVCAAAALALGLLPYAWLPLASAARRLDSWGDLSHLDGFLTHVLRREYGTFQLGGDEISYRVSLVRRLSLYAASLYTEAVYGLMALLGLVGFVLAVARVPQRKAALSIGFAYAFYIVVFNSLANLGLSPLLRGVTARFWQHPNLTVFFFAGVALGRLRNRFSASKWASVLLPSVLVCLLGMQTSYVWPTRDLSAAAEVELYGESILNFMPPNALVLLNGDLNNNAPKYLFGCERKRQDLRLISLQLMSWPWFVPAQASHYEGVVFPGRVYHPFRPQGFSIKQFLDANIGNFPIFICGPWKDGDTSQEAHYKRWAAGLCDRVLPSGKRPRAVARQFRWAMKSLPHIDDRCPFPPDMWEYIVHNDVWAAEKKLFIEATALAGQAAAAGSKLVGVAAEIGRDVLRKNQRLFANDTARRLQSAVLRNAGIVFGMHSQTEPEYEEDMWHAWTLYVQQQQPQGDPAIQQLLRLRRNPYRPH